MNKTTKSKEVQGMSESQNNITWQRFKAVLNGSIDRAKNRGFRMVNGRMVTYEQHKLGLSAYYDKRWVPQDGIPMKFHMKGVGGSCAFKGTTNNSSRAKPRFGSSRK